MRVVYFIADEHVPGGGPIKIGTTEDINRRLAQLNAAAAGSLRVLFNFAGGRSVEAALHRRFAHLRINGEWFQRAPELVGFIRHLQGGGSMETFDDRPGRERLAAWIILHSDTQTAFAAKAGIDPAALSRILAGLRLPRRASAVRIEQATDGAVPVGAWDCRPGKAA